MKNLLLKWTCLAKSRFHPEWKSIWFDQLSLSLCVVVQWWMDNYEQSCLTNAQSKPIKFHNWTCPVALSLWTSMSSVPLSLSHVLLCSNHLEHLFMDRVWSERGMWLGTINTACSVKCSLLNIQLLLDDTRIVCKGIEGESQRDNGLSTKGFWADVSSISIRGMCHARNGD